MFSSINSVISASSSNFQQLLLVQVFLCKYSPQKYPTSALTESSKNSAKDSHLSALESNLVKFHHQKYPSFAASNLLTSALIESFCTLSLSFNSASSSKHFYKSSRESVLFPLTSFSISSSIIVFTRDSFFH